MRARTARWVAGGIAAGSVALMAAGLVLAYVDRHALPVGVTSWDLADVFQNVVNLGVPVLGFALASRRPENPMGWLFLAAGGCVRGGGVRPRGSWPACIPLSGWP